MHSIPLIGVACTLFGLILGSFINALSFRFNTGTSIVHGRSRCMSCGHILSALDLVPLVSYLLLRGRCRYCHSRVSLQYPTVEAAAALLAFGVFLNTQTLLAFLVWLFVWMTILFIVVYDLRHLIIPWSCSIVLLVLTLLVVFSSGVPTTGALVAGPVLAFPLLFLSFVSRGRWMGWGDGTFELSLGWLLGLIPGAAALVLAVWSGAAAGVLLVLWAQRPWKYRTSQFTMKSELPFAPFLALGAAAVYFFHVDLFSSYLSLWN
jgi:leader peptidase (prepilin peptidase)/N-methyltransferase